MKLADALLRRKELQMKVDQLRVIKDADVFEMVVERIKVTESVDNVRARVPKLTMSQVTKEYDYYATQLRKIDAAIQQLNWTTDIEVDKSVWNNYEVEEKQ
jgi:hypothetical protein